MSRSPVQAEPNRVETDTVPRPDAPLVVVGIGAQGWESLTLDAKEAVHSASLVVGSTRQLALLPSIEAELRPWPSPIDSLLEELVSGAAGPACILASGDPMLYGIGATLARRVTPGRLVVHPNVSAFSLACARLGWAAAETELVSASSRPISAVARDLQPGRRLVVYLVGARGAGELAQLLCERGLGASRFIVLERLGADDEHVGETTADEWVEREVDPLHAVALECRETPGDGVPLARSPGLPDDAFESDGQLTKQEVRAITLAALVPLPRQLLWDLGAGSGSIGIEWLRAEETARAIAVEHRKDRAERAVRNAELLGVPHLDVRCEDASEAIEVLPAPDAIFIGGGVTEARIIDRCWEALRPGGRMVANAVTLEGERVLHVAHISYGGILRRIAISRAEPLGGFTGWRPQRPVTQWAARRGT